MTTLLEKLRESTIYYEPEPAPRVRTKPMEVICLGLPRSGTESLSAALAKLGYDYSYHGWDIVFESPHRMIGWVRLARKKWYGSGDGESNITAADFDALLGHSTAVTDAAASVFAAEMIAAYPQAKVVLNRRRDLDKWHQTDGKLNHAVRRNDKWIYREHEAMIRGLVPPERLLEWSVEDGWEPLCKFLNKPVPNEPFPRLNDASAYVSRIQHFYFDEVKRKILRNHAIALGLLIAGASMIASSNSLFAVFTRGL